ncbi:MAG: DNA primase [Bacteroidota bacterium]|nr:DNA primase [Bacteroidota bacterium]
MRIPEETIAEIRRATDIIEYIGMFVKLKKRGKNYIGLCPFHSEKTPSFNVSADKGMYYCFGCHRGGDVIKFVMEWEKASYVEAIEILAERAGIPVQRINEGFQPASETETLYSICSLAARFFYRSLNSEEGKFALDYFRSRGFSDKTITTFGLGYSPRGWGALLQHAEQEGVKPETLEKVGLIRRRDDGTPYDTFRGRAMFPIFSPSGRVVAFGARKLYDDDPLGKYINSSETAIYQKSKILYGLSQAKEAIRERDSVALVEGYADLISVYQSGTRNVVASSGTALTSEQIQLISRYTKSIILVYDADAAGTAAMMRGVDLILEGGLDVRIIQLPEGEDPDSFVRKNGGGAFEELLKKAATFVDFKAAAFLREGKFESPEGRAEAVRALVQTIAVVKDPLKRSFFIKDVAEKYRLYESTLYSELEKYLSKVPDHFRSSFVPSSVPQMEESIEAKAAPNEIPYDERELLDVALEDPDVMVPFIFTYLQPSELTHSGASEVARLLVEEFDEKGSVDVNQLLSKASSDVVRQLIADVTFSPHQLGSRWEEVGARLNDERIWEQASGVIKRLKTKMLQKEREENQRQLKDASLKGENPLPFFERDKEILQKLKELGKLQFSRAPKE